MSPKCVSSQFFWQPIQLLSVSDVHIIKRLMTHKLYYVYTKKNIPIFLGKLTQAP